MLRRFLFLCLALLFTLGLGTPSLTASTVANCVTVYCSADNTFICCGSADEQLACANQHCQ